MSYKLRELFECERKEDFSARLSDWIGDFFYDILPEQGYDVREEQIYTAFQMADAICGKKVHLAEAGLGTGKTFAYLLPAIAYARFVDKPVVIACATTALTDQLCGPEGDIQTLSKIIGSDIDARIAKDPRQYICDERVRESRSLFEEGASGLYEEVNAWLHKTGRGERSEMPQIPDSMWKHIGWDESVNCDMCLSRGFCKLVKAREFYRQATDLIIVDHEVFFDDLWTRQDRLSEGKLPIIPNYGAVIFDEGHKVVLPATLRAGQQIVQLEIEEMIHEFEEIQGGRESMMAIVEALDEHCADFFEKLESRVIEDEFSDRLSIRIDQSLLNAAAILHKNLDLLLLEIQIEQELYMESLPASLIQTYEVQIERVLLGLDKFCRNKSKDVITWVDQIDGSFWVVPRNVHKMLEVNLFKKGLPVVFTSATLSNKGDFSYFTRTMGLEKATSSTVGSAFEYDKQVKVHLAHALEKQHFNDKIAKLVTLLMQNEGSALVLTNSLEEVRKMRKAFETITLPFQIFWEDQGERGYLVRSFRENVNSVLIGSGFWEGIDVPGESLSLLVVWQLPFPSLDPLIEVQRKEAKAQGLDPVFTVDYPEMGLKLKQGCGRLIRTKEDHGTITIMEQVMGTPWEKIVLGALPEGANCSY